jgi:DNA polymerase elongation subunit (family B)
MTSKGGMKVCASNKSKLRRGHYMGARRQSSFSESQRYYLRHVDIGLELIDNQTGHSVLLHVTDFLHYLYVAAPVSFGKSDCDGYKAYLDTQLAQHQPAIHSVQMVLRENLFGFQGNQKSPYLKITVTDPKFINKLRTTIESSLANYKGLWKGVDGGILTFDSIQYVLRFMIDTGASHPLVF